MLRGCPSDSQPLVHSITSKVASPVLTEGAQGMAHLEKSDLMTVLLAASWTKGEVKCSTYVGCEYVSKGFPRKETLDRHVRKLRGGVFQDRMKSGTRLMYDKVFAHIA